jgi:glycosyltransferase involved in cell wall biosynthesis
MNLSVILPFHLINRLLIEAIDSCLKSMPRNSELILLNTSQKKFEFKSASKNIYVIDLPEFTYIQALSEGIKLAKGEFIALMNSDDLVVMTRFHKQLQIIAEEKSDLVFSGIQKFKGKNRKIYPLLGDIRGDSYRADYLLLGSYGANASWLFSASWAKKVNLFSSESDSSDWTTALRVFPESNISYTPEKLYLYRMHEGQITRKNPERHISLESNWMKLNSDLQLPELSSAEIRHMTHPDVFMKSAIEIANINFWFEEYLAHLGDSAIQVRELIDRRLILLTIRSLHGSTRRIRKSVLLKMTSEFFWNSTKPRNKASHEY